jgi:hypothetical protein
MRVNFLESDTPHPTHLPENTHRGKTLRTLKTTAKGIGFVISFAKCRVQNFFLSKKLPLFPETLKSWNVVGFQK